MSDTPITMLRPMGVGRDAENEKSLVVYLNRRATDDELRWLDDYLKGWSEADSKAALIEGWDVWDADSGLEIQRDDEAEIFASDDEAIAWVRVRAADGSDLHLRALRIVGQ